MMNTGWARVSDQFGFYRATRTGWVAGVCAGIAQRLGVNIGWVRLVFVLFGLVLHGIPAVLLYAALAMVMKPAPVMGQVYVAPEVVSNGNLAALKRRFAALDARLNNLEAAVTSEDVSLRRKFRDIGI